MVSHLNRLKAKPGRRPDLVEAIRPIMANVEREGGTLVFAAYEDGVDPDVLWVQELFADETAKRAHTAGPGHDAVLAAVRDLLDGPMQTFTMRPTFGKWTATGL